MGRRKSNVIPMIRDRRRPPRWTTGLPRRRPRRGWRLADPRTFLGAVIVLAATGLVVLPAVADGYLAVARPGSGADGRCRICRVVDGDTARMWCPGRGRRPGPPHRLRRAGTPFAVLPLRTRRRHPGDMGSAPCPPARRRGPARPRGQRSPWPDPGVGGVGGVGLPRRRAARAPDDRRRPRPRPCRRCAAGMVHMIRNLDTLRRQCLASTKALPALSLWEKYLRGSGGGKPPALPQGRSDVH